MNTETNIVAVRKALLVVVIFILAPVLLAHAQVTVSASPTYESSISDGTVNCFDYYKFGSVTAVVSPESTPVSTGSPVTFSGSIKNTNQYPIVDGAVYVKIFKKQKDISLTQENGDFFVDAFFAEKDIVINGDRSVPVSFSWKVPAYAQAGDYYAVTYFETEDRFNLSGLSFTDDVSGSVANFKVVGTASAGVYFDKNTVALNGDTYLFAATLPTFSATSSITASFNLVNDISEDISVPVSYKLYSWDALSGDNLITSSKSVLLVGKNSTKKVSYTITDKTTSVYYLVVEADYKDTKSILDPRFVRQGIDNPRLNFPSTDAYPLKKGVPTSIFTCFYNAANANMVASSSISLKVLDDVGNVLDERDYTAPITSSMTGIKSDFIPPKDMTSFSVDATISSDGKVVDHSRVAYTCGDLLSPNDCASPSPLGSILGDTIYLYIIGGGLLVLLILILMIRKKIHAHHGVALMLFILFALAYSVVSYKPASVDAQTQSTSYSTDGVTWNEVFPQITGNTGVTTNVWINKGLHVQVGYSGGAYDMTDLANPIKIVNGSNVPVGTVVSFINQPFTNTNISWSGTGGSQDTPYAYWDSFPTGGPCDMALASDQLSISGATQPYYLPTMIKKPTVSVIQRGTAQLLDNGDGTYAVTGPGSIVADITFAPTTGLSNLFINWGGWKCKVLVANKFTVPQLVITENLTAVASPTDNNPPSDPAITVTNSGQCVPDGGIMNSTIAVSSTDSDGDQIYYNVTIDGVTTRLPGTGTVLSGTTESLSKKWASSDVGDHTITAKAVDATGGTSNTSTYFLTITSCQVSPPVVTGSCMVDGAFGKAVTISPGSSVELSFEPTNGTGPYTYSWITGESPVVTSVNPYTYTYNSSSITPYSIGVNVTDTGTGNTGTFSGCGIVTVSSGSVSLPLDLYIGSPTALSDKPSAVVIRGNTFGLRWKNSLTIGPADYTCTTGMSSGTNYWSSDWSDSTFADKTNIDGLVTSFIPLGSYDFSVSCHNPNTGDTETASAALQIKSSSIKEI
jgi:hypothetical protein